MNDGWIAIMIIVCLAGIWVHRLGGSDVSEPTEAVYEAAYEAFKRAPLGASIVRACVDAVWPLAEARGYQQAITDLRDEDRYAEWCHRLFWEDTTTRPDRSHAAYLTGLAKERTP